MLYYNDHFGFIAFSPWIIGFLFCFVFLNETGFCCVAQAGLKLTVLLLQLQEYWDYK
jgi:hypothetical protein